jgi:hypothetical protein
MTYHMFVKGSVFQCCLIIDFEKNFWFWFLVLFLFYEIFDVGLKMIF